PMRFGGHSLPFGGLHLTSRLKVMSFMHSPDFSRSSQSHFMSISYFFRGLDRDNRSIALSDYVHHHCRSGCGIVCDGPLGWSWSRNADTASHPAVVPARGAPDNPVARAWSVPVSA